MKKTMFKKSISLMLTVLMIMSCWVFFPGMVPEAEAATTNVGVTTSFTLSPEGNRGNTDWVRLALTGEGSSGGTSVVLFRFSNADLKSLTNASSISLQFYAYSCPDRLTHKSGTAVNADVYYITQNQSYVSSQGTNKSTNVADSNHSVLGSNYGGTYVQNSAKSYFGLSDTTKVGSFEQPAINGNDSANQDGAVNVTCNVTNIVKSKAASGEDLAFIVMLRSAYSCSSSAGWSDIYINSDTIKLSGYTGAYGMPEVGLGNNLDGQIQTTLGSTITIKYPTKMYLDISEDLSDVGYSINISCNGNNRMIVFPAVWGGQESDKNGNFENDRSNYDGSLMGQNTIIDNFDKYGIQKTGNGFFENETASDGDYTTVLVCDNASNYLSSGNNYALQGKPKKTGEFNYSFAWYRNNSKNPNVTYMGGGATTYVSDTGYINGDVNFTIIVYNKSALNTTINNTTLADTESIKYTTASWNAYKTALNNAKNVLAKRETTQDEINNANNELNSKYSALSLATFTIKFNSPSDATAISPKTYTWGQALGATLPVPTRTGYTFEGWWIDLDGNGVQNGDEGGGEPLAYADGTIRSDLQNFAITQDWALISVWTINQYTVKFVNAAGTTVSEKIYNYGENPEVPANTSIVKTATTHTVYKWLDISSVTDNVTYQETVSTNNHEWVINESTDADGWHITQIPDCNNTGEKTRICDVCNYSETETLPADISNHRDTIEIGQTNATCTTDGYTAGVWCYICESWISGHEPIPAAHTPGTDATCTTAQTCTVCGETIKGALGHSAAAPVEENRQESTCTVAGSYESVVYCSVCSTLISKETKSLPLADHTEVDIPAVAATCTSTGLTAGKKCSACGVTTVEQTVTEMLPHTEVEIPAVGATCTAPGKTAGKECSVCHNVTLAPTETEMLGHDYDSWTDYGFTTHRRVCERCSASEEGTHLFNSIIRQVEGTKYHEYKCEKCDAYGVGTTKSLKEDCFGNGTTFAQIADNAVNHTETCKCGREQTVGHAYGEWGIANGVKSRECSECKYVESVNVYTVTWKNGDTVLDTESYAYGTLPTYKGETPAKESTAEYNYEFDGWTPEVSEVTGDVTFTAKFEEVKRSYTITWKNDDGSIIDTTTVEYGVVPTHADATKANTAEYTYTFKEWSPAVVAVTGEAEYTATYTETKNSYTITWIIDGVETTEEYEYGATPSHADPTKEADAQYTYTFAAWEPAISTVTGDATYTAQFNSTVNEYTITWVDGNGDTLKTEQVAYGETPAYTGDTPTKAADAQYTYTFNNTWSPEIVAVTEAATYIAQFDSTVNEYTIKFVNENGIELQSSKVAYGETPVYTGETPTKEATAQYTYTFKEWTPTVSEVTGEATYTATYTATVNKYTVIWKNEDGTVLETDENVEYGTTPSYDGETPTKAATAQDTFAFTGWDPAISEVTGDATYTAKFSSTTNEYTVTFNFADGKEPVVAKYLYGTTADNITVPANTEAYNDKDGHHTFAWPEIKTVEDVVVYEEKETIDAHSYGETWTQLDNDSTKHYKDCEVCGDTGRITEACVASEWIVEKDATCTAVGSKYKECTTCGREMAREEIPMIAHEFAGTATTAGTDVHDYQCQNVFDGIQCTVRGAVKDGVHTAGATETCSGGEATCTEKAVCDKCGTKYGTLKAHDFTEQAKIDKDDKSTLIREADCENDSLYYMVCSACEISAKGIDENKTWTDEKAAGHNFTGDTNALENGKHNFKCKNCDSYGIVENGEQKKGASVDCEYTASYTYKDAENHTAKCLCGNEKDVAHTESAKATCTESAYCDVCKNSYGSALDHSKTYKEAKEPDCENTGNYEYWYCSRCDKYFADEACSQEKTLADLTRAAAGHNFTGNAVEVTATTHAFKCINKDCDAVGTMDGDTANLNGTVDCSFTAAYKKLDKDNHTAKCLCGNSVTESHTWNEGTVNPDSTCTEEGEKHFECTECGETKTETVEKKSHQLVETPAVEETCVKDGNIQYWTCSVCSKIFSDEEAETEITKEYTVIEKIAHKNKEHYEKKDATCVSEGTIEYWACPDCGKNFTDVECTVEVTELKIDKNDNHVKTTSHNETPAICLEVGYTAGTYCEDCKKWISGHVEIEAIAHKNKVHHEKVDETCEDDGTIEYWACPDCDKNFTDAECTAEADTIVITKKGHDYDVNDDGVVDDKDGAVTTEPECEKDGVRSFICQNDASHTDTKVIPQLGHIDENPANGICDRCNTDICKHTETTHTEGKDSTCIATGNIEYWTCQRCGKNFAEQECKTVVADVTIKVKSHSYTGAVKSDGNGENATHSFKCVNGCDEYGNAEAHGWNGGEVTTAPDCVNTGSRTFTCTVEGCGGTYTAVEPADGHKLDATAAVTETCTANGNIAYWTCSTCNKVFTDSEAKTEIEDKNNNGKKDADDAVVAALGHNFTEDAKSKGNDAHDYKCSRCDVRGAVKDGVYTAGATEACTGGTATCTAKAVCDECQTEYGSALGHNMTKTEANTATCTTDGNIEYWTCQRCKKLYLDVQGNVETTAEAVVIKATHKWDEEYTVDTVPTCTEKGSESIHCSACEETKDSREISAKGHDYDVDDDGVVDDNDGTVTAKPTCTEKGEMTYTCQNDETHTYKDDIDALDHIDKNPVDGVCDREDCKKDICDHKDDNKDHVCDNECKVYQGTHSDDNKDHICDYGCEDAIGDCTDSATDGDHICDYGCGKVLEDCDLEIEYLASTCTRDGYSKSICKICNKGEERVHQKLGHNFSGETVIIEPTCTTEGSKNIKCTRCDELKFVEAYGEASHHFVTLSDAVSPTCILPGKEVSKACVKCGLEAPGKVIPARGHTEPNEEGKCDVCSALVYDASKYCTCLCHNDSFFMKIIYKIALFFWKLFKMNPSCDCGFVHYE